MKVGVFVKEVSQILKNKELHVYDSREMPFEETGETHFALVDAFLKDAGTNGKYILHFWPTERQVFLGMMDTKLPYLEDGLSEIRKNDYDYIVRNSGGLAVVGDEGVLNLSLIIPLPEDNPISIDEGYDLLLDLLNDALPSEVEAFEIPDSYCPGDYDLSIAGKKIAGLSQRRSQGGLSIMIYISVNGNQKKRSQMMRNFYDAGLQGEDTKWSFPEINPEVMTTLEEVYDTDLTVDGLIAKIKEVVADYGAVLTKGEYNETLTSEFDTAYEKMERRNKKMLGDHY